MKLPLDSTVLETVRNIVKRQPLSRPSDDYGLFLPDAEGADGTSGGGRWLQDSQPLGDCNVANVRFEPLLGSD
jgi:hypothetical protein